MCVPILAPVLSALGGGGSAAATASGAAAAAGSAVSLGQILQVAGLAASVGGQIAQGQAAHKTAEVQVEQIEAQKRTEAQLSAVREERARQKFRSAIATQRAQIAGRGVALNSPTAVLLGETAAREMSYEAQAIRAGGLATRAELTGTQALLRARGTEALLKGRVSAAGTFLNDAPDIWPELLA